MLARRLAYVLLSMSVLARASNEDQLFAQLRAPNSCLAKSISFRETVAKQLPRPFMATILTNATLDWKAKRVKYAACPEGDNVSRLYVGMQVLIAEGERSAVQQERCTAYYPSAIVYNRPGPKTHFGHRILTDVPSFFALKYLFNSREQNIFEFPVVLVDNYGPPISGLPELQAFYDAVGNLNVTFQNIEPDTVLCFGKVIFLATYWHKVWYIDQGGNWNGIWERPDMLLDADPFLLKVVGEVRQQFGLPAELPFAPSNPANVVLASRNAVTRKRLGMHIGRTLDNEDELATALRQIPSVTVQVVLVVGVLELQLFLCVPFLTFRCPNVCRSSFRKKVYERLSSC